jgi:hypothetical protein
MDARTRLGWVRLYEQVGDASLVCRRCGISEIGGVYESELTIRKRPWSTAPWR